ncbi:MAG TPA: ectonucleotide pyrophosphatase/phosphodiesterase [Terracidiphilus sp.]|jgi:alkaline phosphatase D|nr:ectonucleotide pyrophosphatase/phosphodiesterase [Terracidiphilus sp.]
MSMLIRIFRQAALALAALSLMPASWSQPGVNPALPLVHVDNGPNSPAAQQAHTVVLVSLDGFRWDYAKRDGARHLLALGRKGVSAPDGMLPSFPSVTYPNHLSIVTGLYPEHHGIVANTFYDPERKARYSPRDPETIADGTWYSGVPLWSLAENQGMRTACLFWPGSEAEIAGHRPTWYLRYAEAEFTDAAEQARIHEAVELLKLPAAERPHFIAIYLNDTDEVGHRFGPDSPQTKAAVLKMDSMVEKLKAALDKTGLPIDLVVVSDHGMAKIDAPWVTLDEFTSLANFETEGQLLYGKTEEDRLKAYNELKHAAPEFVVYRRNMVPANLHYDANPREGDPVIIATGPYVIRAHKPPASKPDEPPSKGAHGFDPHSMPEMKAIFFAEGPDIAPGKTVKPFENVNLYPWMAHMLGLTPPKNDGNLNILAGTLRDNGGTAPEDGAGSKP